MTARPTFRLAGAFVVLVWFAGSSRADLIPVPNSSFEMPAQGPGGFTFAGPGNTTAVPGWTISGNAGGVFRPAGIGGFSEPLPAPALGNQYAFLEAPASGSTTSITTTLPVATVLANSVYTLTVALGHRLTGDRQPDDYLIELLVGNTVVASNTLNNAFSTIPPSTFVDLSASFSSTLATIGGNLFIRLTHSSNSAVFRQGAFDNVRLDQAAQTAGAIPEPATLAVWGIVVGTGLVVTRRKRRTA